MLASTADLCTFDGVEVVPLDGVVVVPLDGEEDRKCLRGVRVTLPNFTGVETASCSGRLLLLASVAAVITDKLPSVPSLLPLLSTTSSRSSDKPAVERTGSTGTCSDESTVAEDPPASGADVSAGMLIDDVQTGDVPRTVSDNSPAYNMWTLQYNLTSTRDNHYRFGVDIKLLLCAVRDDNDWPKRCITWEVEGVRQDAGRGPGGIVLRMTWKVWVCPKGMRSPGINGEGELRGNRLTQVHLEKWLIKRSVCE